MPLLSEMGQCSVSLRIIGATVQNGDEIVRFYQHVQKAAEGGSDVKEKARAREIEVDGLEPRGKWGELGLTSC